MKRLIMLSPFLLFGISLFVGSAYGVTINSLNVGNQITINDTIPDSTYNYHASGPSESLGPAGEDNETERRGSTNTLTGNWWDFEAMYYNSGEGTLTIFAGFNLADPYGSHQIGDLFFGFFSDNNPLGNTYTARYVLDLNLDALGGDYTGYDIYDDNSLNYYSGVTLAGVTDIFPYSNPYALSNSGSSESLYTGVNMISHGKLNDKPFYDWGKYDSNSSYPSTDHYFLKIAGLNNFFGTHIPRDSILHLTLDCGNDTVRGQAPVPEPTSMLLLGTGLIGMASLRRRFKKS